MLDSQQVATLSTSEYLALTRLVEEVPGVPKDEQYFIRHERKKVWQGPTIAAGQEWAEANGVTIDYIERFEP